jgi:Gas vesicle protein
MSQAGTSLAPSNLADILERVLDKGVVIAGDISVAVGGVELLSIKIRLIIASVERAQAMGIDWWNTDPSLSSGRNQALELEQGVLALEMENRRLALELENTRLRSEIDRLQGTVPAIASKSKT